MKPLDPQNYTESDLAKATRFMRLFALCVVFIVFGILWPCMLLIAHAVHMWPFILLFALGTLAISEIMLRRHVRNFKLKNPIKEPKTNL